MEPQFSACDIPPDVFLSHFSNKGMEYMQVHIYKIRALYFHCRLLLIDFRCGTFKNPNDDDLVNQFFQ